MTASLKIHEPTAQRICPEIDIIRECLPLEGARVLELGCGKAEMTRLIAEQFPGAEIVATEVDDIQHAKNLAITDLPQVRFCVGGAEAIAEPDASFDAVLMFKSLHHVPLPLLDQALAEVRRVLKPGGFAYLSEPIFAGDFNDILRLFHDEQQVREAAFAAVTRTVESGALECVKQLFFSVPATFPDFETFEERVINVTYAEHRLDDALYLAVRKQFMAHMTEQGASFLKPMRVDLLRRPLGS